MGKLRQKLYYHKEKVLNFLNQQLENPADLDLQENSKLTSDKLGK
jgi:hypothetical protein